MVLRVIPTTVRTTEELRLPPVIEKIADENRGLVLVTGSTGSGKSTTLAAMIDYMNRTRTGHIVTIEDPIEFLHRDKKSYVNQREVDVDTEASQRRCEGRFDKIPTLFWSAKCATMRLLKPQSQRRPASGPVYLHTLDATETLNRIVSVFLRTSSARFGCNWQAC